MSGDGHDSTPRREGKLSIPLPFEDALRAVLRVKPEPEPAKPEKSRRKAAPRPARRHGTAP
jgi:hypothetical protein